MRKFLALVRVNFRAMLAAFSLGRGKKRAAGGIGALLFLSFIALYMSGVYSVLFGQLLSEAGLFEFFVPVMSTYAGLMALMLTLFAAGGLLFGGKDNDLMLSLPVSAFSVLLSKVTALYLENLVFCGLWMLPVLFVQGRTAGGVDALFVLRAAAVVLLVPLAPTVPGILLGFCTTWITARLQHKGLLASILYFIFFGFVMLGALQFNRLPQLMAQNPAGVRRLFSTWLLPFGLVGRSVSERVPGALALLLLVCVVPLLAVVWLVSLRYKKILTTLSSHRTRSDYRLRDVKASGTFAALFRKEAGRYFGTPIYFFNTGFGVMMLLGGSVYLCFARTKVLPYMEAMGGAAAVAPMAAAAVLFLMATVCTTCVSLSLEGNTLWILKEAPIPAAQLLGAKALLNVLVALLPALIALAVITPVLGLPPLPMLAAGAASVPLAVFVALFGLWDNLLLPKMDCPNDTIVVKQSASAMVGIFGGMLLVGAGIGVYLWFGHLAGFSAYVLVCGALLAAADVLLWRWLRTRGARRLLAL